MLDIVYRKARRCAYMAFRRTGGGAGVISEGRAKFWLESGGCSAESALSPSNGRSILLGEEQPNCVSSN